MRSGREVQYLLLSKDVQQSLALTVEQLALVDQALLLVGRLRIQRFTNLLLQLADSCRRREASEIQRGIDSERRRDN